MEARSYEGYEVDGRNVRNVTDVFRLFRDAGLKPFVKRGIGTQSADGRIVLDPSGWYPLGPWLEAYYEILELVGPNKVYEIGKQIPKNAPFPPHLRDARSALESLDIAYHINHRKDGQIMFDAKTSVMLEGIGHYRYVAQREPRRALLECDDPYPCELDRGVVVSLVGRFEKGAVIEHLDEAHCRNRGGTVCRYAVCW